MNVGDGVRARDLTKSFGDVIALDGVDLDVAPGRIHGLIGPNGAGKTTLLGLLLGLAVPDSGSLEVLGVPVRGPLDMAAGVAGFVDGPGLYPALTARGNLAAQSALRGDDPGRIDETLERVGLRDVADDRVRGFSLGMRQRLGLAAALLTAPRLLVLDEPANGLDPSGSRLVYRVLREVADAGTAVILSSHRMDDLAALCSDVTLLLTGRVVFSGAVEKLALESGALEHRLRTSDRDAAIRVARATPGVQLVSPESAPYREGDDSCVVQGTTDAVDDLVVALVEARIAVRELTPVVSPLEAAFLVLTEGPAAATAEVGA